MYSFMSKVNNKLINIWEKFTAYDWERYADIFARLSMISCFIFASFTWIFSYNMWIGLYTFLLGIFFLLVETNSLSSISLLNDTKDFLLSKVYLGHPIVKGVVYYILSIPCFLAVTPAMGTAILICITSLLEFFAQCNRYADANDALMSNPNPNNSRSRNNQPIPTEPIDERS